MDSSMRERKCIIAIVLVNIMHAIFTLVFIFHLLIRDSMLYYTGNLDLGWAIRLLVLLISFAVINVQVSMDVILIKNLADMVLALGTCRHWIRMTTAYQVVQIVGFYLSIFYRHTHGQPVLILFLALSSFFFRTLGLYKVNLFLAQLQALLPPGLQQSQVYFITLSPEFYRSQSQASINSSFPTYF